MGTERKPTCQPANMPTGYSGWGMRDGGGFGYRGVLDMWFMTLDVFDGVARRMKVQRITNPIENLEKWLI